MDLGNECIKSISVQLSSVVTLTEIERKHGLVFIKSILKQFCSIQYNNASDIVSPSKPRTLQPGLALIYYYTNLLSSSLMTIVAVAKTLPPLAPRLMFVSPLSSRDSWI